MKAKLGLEMRPVDTQEVQPICNCCGQPYYPNKSWEDRIKAIILGAEKYAICPLCAQAISSVLIRGPSPGGSSASWFSLSFSERPSAISARTRTQKSQGQSGLLVHFDAAVGTSQTTTSPVRRWTNSMEPSSSFRRCHIPGSATGVGLKSTSLDRLLRLRCHLFNRSHGGVLRLFRRLLIVLEIHHQGIPQHSRTIQRTGNTRQE